jgi:hypothetical protein
MDSINRDVFITGRYCRMVAIATLNVYMLCCIPWNGSCLENSESQESQRIVGEIVHHIDSQNSESLTKKFDKLNKIFDSSKDSPADGRLFLHTVIKELNDKYGVKLTLSGACKLVRENLSALNLSEEFQNVLLSAIELYESDPMVVEVYKEKIKNNVQVIRNLNNLSVENGWIRESFAWSWFSPTSPSKHKHMDQHKESNHPEDMDKDLPSECYFGGCEMLAGALIYIVPIPGAAWVGRLMMGDGIRRLVSGTIQLGEERRNAANMKEPKFMNRIRF